MEFMNRGNNTQPTAAPRPPQQPAGQPPKKSGEQQRDGSFWLRVSSVIVLFGVTVLLVALTASFFFDPKRESDYIDSDRMQAVFLEGGQVYFGKITDLNDKYLRMEDIFYLRDNQTIQPNQANSQSGQKDILLVKRGCELHRPTNEMLINRSQVLFWEDLKDETGEKTVPGAVKNFRARYPDGQECQEVNTNSGANGAANGGAASTSPVGSDAGNNTDAGVDDAGPAPTE